MFWHKKIDFLVIGAQKSGTSSFYQYLTSNLMIHGGQYKEIHFFDLFHDKGKNWYHQHFNFEKNSLFGECTPFYLMHPLAPARAQFYNPKLKMMAILRNPVERAWSHYLMNVEAGRENLDFETALDKEQERLASTENFNDPNSNFLHFSYASRGLYANQLNRWTEYFREDQLLLFNYEDFFKNPWLEIQRAYQFLGVAPLMNHVSFHENASNSIETIPTAASKKLNDYFREPNELLATKYGIGFE